ncbi:hypothetical protein MC7420_6188 [Coleofasciculus chthonoplastes PCC 7420]|uniref:Uncharacterized protein n=1 Tax=Coleofasciculus chthonoplastes PCC 7420 TaxID=118168 RepID=B4VTG3_9CYAN|nr:hypothetical protein MC7420_6188 [Coleofasciculus chthonoplastes PCC 7420]
MLPILSPLEKEKVEEILQKEIQLINKLRDYEQSIQPLV